MNPYLIINTLLLLISTCTLSILLVRKISIAKAVKTGFNKIVSTVNDAKVLRQYKQYTYNISRKMNIIDNIELNLIANSNIKMYIPFFNFYILIICCLLIFVFLYIPVYKVLYSITSTTIICFVFSLIPMFILELMGKRNSDIIRKNLSRFISILSRWCEVKEDIFFAFEKSVDSGIGEPLKSNIKELVIQIKHGVDPIEALYILEMKIRNPQFKIFIINIKQNFKARGDILKLLSNLEDQFYALDEEYSRLKISTFIDRITIYIAMFCVLFIGYYILKNNQSVHDFYLGTINGKILMSLFCLMFAAGVYITTKITKFEY